MRSHALGNGDRMHVILNGEPLEEVDCFKYLGSQVAADGGCERDVVHRMNEGYRAWGALKSVKTKVKSSMARSLPVENLLPQNVGSIINYLQ